MITSSQNTRIKDVRSLRNRKYREATGRFLSEGIRLSVEAARSTFQVETVVIAPDRLRSDVAMRAVEVMTANGAEVLEVSPAVFATVAERDNPQGIAVVCRQSWRQLRDLDLQNQTCALAIARSQNPGNVGSIIRTSAAVGSAGVILIDSSTDPYDPGAVRGSMGSIFNEPLVRCSMFDLQEHVRQESIHMVASDGGSTVDFRDHRYAAPLILLMGSEREGLLPEELGFCEAAISIPMCGEVDSLNVAVAAGIILYEVNSQLAGRREPTQELRSPVEL